MNDHSHQLPIIFVPGLICLAIAVFFDQISLAGTRYEIVKLSIALISDNLLWSNLTWCFIRSSRTTSRRFHALLIIAILIA